jgi:ankyrin repeat protein
LGAIASRDLCFFSYGLARESSPECEQDQFDFLSVVQQLLDAGVDPNAVDKLGNSPLFWVGDDPDIAEVLIENGANVNLKNKDGLTPLMESIFSNHYELAKLLLQKGADTAIRDLKGKTALDYAVEQDAEEIILLLKEAE